MATLVKTTWRCARCLRDEFPARPGGGPPECYDGRRYGYGRAGRLCSGCRSAERDAGRPVPACALCGTDAGGTRRASDVRPARFRCPRLGKAARVCLACHQSDGRLRPVRLRRCDGCRTTGGHLNGRGKRPVRIRGDHFGRPGKSYCQRCAVDLRHQYRREVAAALPGMLADARARGKAHPVAQPVPQWAQLGRKVHKDPRVA